MFSTALNLAYDLNRGFAPADGTERATREEIVGYIDAHSVDKPPDHPTTAIAWDLQRTLGQRDGRRLLLYASHRWDAKPLQARDVVKMWWWPDHEPEAWRDEYLVDVIQGWRSERDRLAAQKADEDVKIAAFERKLKPVTILPFPAPAPVPAAPLPDLLTTSAEFIAGFVSPEYLIDGIVQRRYFYSMTAGTGVGKTSIAMRWMAHVVAGRPIGDSEVQQGSVLYLAGENPDDVRARWLALSREMGIDPDTDKVTWIVGAKDLGAVAQAMAAEAARKGLSFAYVIVDTAAAYNGGDDENSNNQAGAYARQLRTLTNLPGGPCVVVLCHPTKRAADDDLMPRGGGAFLAEVDGNMAVIRKDSLLVVVPFGKFRGDMSWTQRYEIEVIKDHPKLKDARGRQMKSVLARPVGNGAAAVMETRVDRDTEMVLAAVHATPAPTPAALARALAWTYGAKSEPNINKVNRSLERLAKQKLVVERLGTWRATSLGEKELNAIDMKRAASLVVPPPPLPRIV